MTDAPARLALPVVLCMAMGAVLAVAGGAVPGKPDLRQAALAAAEPFIALREGPATFLPSLFAKKPEPAVLTAKPKPRREKPFIDLSPIDTALSEDGFRLIAESEGLRLKAYYLADQWLVGYGHARIAYEGLEITPAEAEALLHRDIHDVEQGLARLLTVPVNENEYAALVSLAYNMGLGGFERSLVYQRLIKGDRAGAADAFRYLTTAKINGVRTEMPVLAARRERERALFLTPVGPKVIEADAFQTETDTDTLSDI